MEVLEVQQGTSNEGELEVGWRLKQSASCKKLDTAKPKKLKEIKESENPALPPEPSVNYEALDEFAEVVEDRWNNDAPLPSDDQLIATGIDAAKKPVRPARAR